MKIARGGVKPPGDEMTDFYEVDFRQVHTSKSGDAIAIRYQIGNQWSVHLVDGGYATTAPDIAKFIRNTYGFKSRGRLR